MSRLVLLSVAQMKRLAPHFPRSRGLARVDDRRVIRGIVYVIRNLSIPEKSVMTSPH